jgi:hypothetical protein
MDGPNGIFGGSLTAAAAVVVVFGLFLSRHGCCSSFFRLTLLSNALFSLEIMIII